VRRCVLVGAYIDVNAHSGVTGRRAATRYDGGPRLYVRLVRGYGVVLV